MNEIELDVWNVIAVRRKCRGGNVQDIYDFLAKQSSWNKRLPSDAAVHSRGTRNFEMGGAKSLMMKIFRAQA